MIDDTRVRLTDGQDMYLYNVKQAARHGGYNFVTIIVSEKGVVLDGALKWLADSEYHGQVSNFRAQYRLLPSWGPGVDADVSTFLKRLVYWIRGIACCSLETENYLLTSGRRRWR
jgi:hypothetical protein